MNIPVSKAVNSKVFDKIITCHIKKYRYLSSLLFVIGFFKQKCFQIFLEGLQVLFLFKFIWETVPGFWAVYTKCPVGESLSMCVRHNQW